MASTQSPAGLKGSKARPKPQTGLLLPSRSAPNTLDPRTERDLHSNGLKTPAPTRQTGNSTPRAHTPRIPFQTQVTRHRTTGKRGVHPHADIENQEDGHESGPSGLPQWAAHSPVQLGTNNEFPDIISEPTNWDDPITEDGWELRTETVGMSDQYDDTSVSLLRTQHQRQLTHYKNLLVRSQSASSSSLHDIHSQLHVLQRQYNILKAEHDQCERRKQALRDDIKSGLRGLENVKDNLQNTVKDYSKEDRIKLMGLVVEACHPSDINAQIEILKKYRRSKYDILSRLDDHLAIRVLNVLDVRDILNLRLVSKGYRRLTKDEELWNSLCRQLEWRDWDGEAGLSHIKEAPAGGWEELYKSLWRRENNWNAGLVSPTGIRLIGHTNYVTSLRLRGDILISGSYDESIRIWSLPPLSTLSPSSTSPPLVLPAKSVSCLDYYPSSEVFVAGYHDVGRVQVWKKKVDQWELQHTLSGHLHGIRAVALNDNYLVSAGADKALVVWSWRTGEKIVRFGQQTNICVGIQLVYDYIIAVTVDGIIRTFDIKKREMLAQFKISDLAKSLDSSSDPDSDDGASRKEEWRSKLKQVGGGQGGVGMINWFEGQGRWMACATREMIIRLEWDEVEEVIRAQTPLVSPATPSPSKPRTRTASSVSRGLTTADTVTITPTKAHASAMLKQRTAPTTSPSVTSKRSGPSFSPSVRQVTPMSRAVSGTAGTVTPGSPSPLRGRGKLANTITSLGATTSPSSPSQSTSPRKSALSSPALQISQIDPHSTHTRTRMVPLLTRAPNLIELINIPDVEKGAIDARRTRVVTSTRFAARTGANRHLYIGVPKSASASSETSDPEAQEDKGTTMIPVLGAWADSARQLNLQTPEKNPMSLVLDREKFVYGCTDGSIVVVGFVRHDYGSAPKAKPDLSK